MALFRIVLFLTFAIALVHCGCGDNGKLNRCTGVQVHDGFPINDETEFDAQVFQTIVSLDHNTLSVLTPMGCYTFELTYCDCSADAGEPALTDMCSKISIRSPKFCQITKEGYTTKLTYKALYDAAVTCDTTYKNTNGGVYNCLTNCCKTWRSQMRKLLGLPSSMFGACPGAVKAVTIPEAMKKMQKNNPDEFGPKYLEYQKRALGGDPDGRDEFDPDQQSCPLPPRKKTGQNKKEPGSKKKSAPKKKSPPKKKAPPKKKGEGKKDKKNAPKKGQHPKKSKTNKKAPAKKKNAHPKKSPPKKKAPPKKKSNPKKKPPPKKEEE